MGKFIVTLIFLGAVVMHSYVFAEQEKFTAIRELKEKDVEGLTKEKITVPAPEEEAIARPHVEYKAQDLRDPFQGPFVKEQAVTGAAPGVSTPATPPALEVQGIIWGGVFPLGIINNKVVKIGDIIEGAQIMDINQNGVSVISGNYTYNLPSPAQRQAQEHQGGEK